MKRLVLVILTVLYVLGLVAQTVSNDTSSYVPAPKVGQFQKPVFRGLSLHFDIASPFMGLIYGRIYNYEAQLDVNLYRRIYPIFELGYTSAIKELESGAKYMSRAPFFRIGLNYGLIRPVKRDGKLRSVKSYPFIGLRYAFSTMNYSIENVLVEDRYWGTSDIVGFDSPFAYSGWLEVVGGVRIDIYKGITMGWSARFKTLLHTTAPDKAYVWYVPGYGKSSAAAFAFNYTIGYTFYYDSDKDKKKTISSL